MHEAHDNKDHKKEKPADKKTHAAKASEKPADKA